jgi:hypothetical protein
LQLAAALHRVPRSVSIKRRATVRHHSYSVQFAQATGDWEGSEDAATHEHGRGDIEDAPRRGRGKQLAATSGRSA